MAEENGREISFGCTGKHGKYGWQCVNSLITKANVSLSSHLYLLASHPPIQCTSPPPNRQAATYRLLYLLGKANRQDFKKTYQVTERSSLTPPPPVIMLYVHIFGRGLAGTCVLHLDWPSQLPEPIQRPLQH